MIGKGIIGIVLALLGVVMPAAAQVSVDFYREDGTRYVCSQQEVLYDDFFHAARFSVAATADAGGLVTFSLEVTYDEGMLHVSAGDSLTLVLRGGDRVILTTDHGSIRADRPVKIVGDRNTNTNLRYKLGKNLSYNSKDLFVIKEPQKAQLPAPNLSTSYVFATGNDFFAYPNNYNYYVQYYKDTFQHGGISMEEMLIPLITMKGRKK